MFVWMTHLSGNRRASASLLGAFLIMTNVLVVTFTIQVSDLYIVQLKVQRAADLATLAATLGATAPVVSSGAASASAVATALNVASLNGFGGSTVTTTGGMSGGTPTLTTTISNTPSPIMGSWMNAASPVVAAPARALMTPVVVADCIATLGGSFQISGSATVSAPGCGLASQSTIDMSGGSFTAGAAVVGVGVHAYDEIPHITGGSQSPGTGAFMYNAVTSDTAAANASIKDLRTHLDSLTNANWPYPTIPKAATAQAVSPVAGTQAFVNQTVSVPANTHAGAVTITNSTLNFTGSGGGDITCASPTTVSGATFLSGSNTLNFASGCYIFNGSVSTVAGSSTSININAGARVTFCFQNILNMNAGGTLSLSDADQYSFGGNILIGNGGSFSVGKGTKLFSGNITNNDTNATLSFGDGESYLNGTIINGGNFGNGSLVFGNGLFFLWNGAINNPGNMNMNFGTGPFYFYNSTITDADRGQGQMNFAGGDYYFYGGSITSGQNVFAKIQFVAGNMDLYAGTSVTVNSPIRFGSAVTPSGNATVSLYGGSVTVIGNRLSLLGSTLAMKTGAVTVAAGGSLDIVPPTNATPNFGHTNIALLSIGGDVNVTAGTWSIGGLIYAPNNAVTVSGSAILQRNGSCLSLAANAVALSGSSRTTLSPCTGLSAASTGISSTLNQ